MTDEKEKTEAAKIANAIGKAREIETCCYDVLGSTIKETIKEITAKITAEIRPQILMEVEKQLNPENVPTFPDRSMAIDMGNVKIRSRGTEKLLACEFIIAVKVFKQTQIVAITNMGTLLESWSHQHGITWDDTKRKLHNAGNDDNMLNFYGNDVPIPLTTWMCEILIEEMRSVESQYGYELGKFKTIIDVYRRSHPGISDVYNAFWLNKKTKQQRVLLEDEKKALEALTALEREKIERERALLEDEKKALEVLRMAFEREKKEFEVQMLKTIGKKTLPNMQAGIEKIKSSVNDLQQALKDQQEEVNVGQPPAYE